MSSWFEKVSLPLRDLRTALSQVCVCTCTQNVANCLFVLASWLSDAVIKDAQRFAPGDWCLSRCEPVFFVRFKSRRFPHGNWFKTVSNTARRRLWGWGTVSISRSQHESFIRSVFPLFLPSSSPFVNAISFFVSPSSSFSFIFFNPDVILCGWLGSKH